MNIPFVDLETQYKNHKDEIDNAIQNVIADTGFIRGPYVKKFEKEYAEKYGIKHCIGVANGTDAIYIALKMLGIGHGDEVITVANSWISTSETISQTGATPVFIDIEAEYYNIDTTKIEEKITDDTKAIVPVHLYGQPAKIDDIIAIADKYDLYVVEDCAQAHFAKFNSNYVGKFGDVATFSFYPGKNLGAYGDAGAIITDNDDLARKCRAFSNHGSLQKHDHEMEGINSRLDGIQAAILSVKLTHILEWNKKRLEHAKLYNTLLEGIEEVVTPKIRRGSSHIFHLYVVRSDERDNLQQYLKVRGIPTSIHYPKPLPLLDIYESLGYSKSDIPIASKYRKEILSLPIYPEMKDAMIEYIVNSISEFYEKKA